MVDRLQSEGVVVQSPTSFSGSARRIWKLTWVDNPLLKWGLAVPAALLLIGVVWLLVAGWYVLFGLLLVPWRLLRRGSRKRKRDEMRHREGMQASQWPQQQEPEGWPPRG